VQNFSFAHFSFALHRRDLPVNIKINPGEASKTFRGEIFLIDLESKKHAQGFRSKNPFALLTLCIWWSYSSPFTANGTSICSAAVLRLYLLRRRATLELRDEHQAEADIVVAVARVSVVAIRGAAILRVVVPAAAAQNTVRTHD